MNEFETAAAVIDATRELIETQNETVALGNAAVKFFEKGHTILEAEDVVARAIGRIIYRQLTSK